MAGRRFLSGIRTKFLTELDDPIMPSDATNKVYVDEKSEFNSNREVTRSGVPNITVGGSTLKEFLEGYFFPAVPPTLSFSGLGGPYEQGVERNFNLSATVTPNDATIDLREFRQSSTILSTEPSNSMAHTVENIKNNVTYTARVEYTLSGNSGLILSQNRSASFYPPTFYGVGAAGNENETWVKANLTKTIRGNNNLTANFSPTLERYYFVYPQSFGSLNQVLDPNNFDITGAFTEFTATFSLADSTPVDYYIYRSNDDTTQSGYQLRFT